MNPHRKRIIKETDTKKVWFVLGDSWACSSLVGTRGMHTWEQGGEHAIEKYRAGHCSWKSNKGDESKFF